MRTAEPSELCVRSTRVVLVDYPKRGLVTLWSAAEGSVTLTLCEYAHLAVRGDMPVAPVGHARVAMELIRC